MKKNLFLSAVIIAITLVSCSKKVTETKSKTASTKPVTEKKPEKAGIIFKASGTEPFWDVAISTTEITYTSANKKESFTVPYAPPVKAADANVKMYRAKSAEHEIEITIQQGECSDGMSDKKQPFSAKVGVKKTNAKDFKVMNGCGSYLPDDKLNGKWILQQIKDKRVKPTDFAKAELPSMDISTASATFSGYAGCNRMKGSLVFSGQSSILFSNVITTKMMCEGGMESAFLQAFQIADKYVIKGETLYLSNGVGVQTVFVKPKK